MLICLKNQRKLRYRTFQLRLWALERQAFAVLVQGAVRARRAEIDALLQKVEFLTAIDTEDRTRLADAVKYQHLNAGEAVFSQGDAGESMSRRAAGQAERSC